jgi:hypothetical protein
MFGDEEAVVLAHRAGLHEALDRLIVEIGDAGFDGVSWRLRRISSEDWERTVNSTRGLWRSMARVRSETIGEAEGMTPSTSLPTSSPFFELDRGEFLLEGLPVVEDEMRPFQHALAFGGQADVALAALHDGNAQLLLQLADAARERGLRDVAGLGRAGEMLFARKGSEILELTDIHDRRNSPMRGHASRTKQNS